MPSSSFSSFLYQQGSSFAALILQLMKWNMEFDNILVIPHMIMEMSNFKAFMKPYLLEWSLPFGWAL